MNKTAAPEPVAAGNPYLAALAAWVLPGAGHFYLRRRLRGLLFGLVVLVTLGVGWSLEGNLYRFDPAHPVLSVLGTLAEMGLGTLYFVFRGLGYHGMASAPGYEYGTTFFLTSGLMNLLLVLDAWDIARGRKE